MHITKIELENIKSHSSAIFEFPRGTIAITGENGAGKTTLIEAIAWTLFDILDYKKDEFLRRGAKKGSARVYFESGLDGREYMVYRDTLTGYYVHDQALKTRIAVKREEVCRFLWQHLGVEPGTDLGELFRHAIGVPQGTSTSIFLEAPSRRKDAFDKLLKVEEYRRGFEELLRTVRHIETRIAEVSVKIARAEGELGRFDAIQEEHATVTAQAGSLATLADEAAAAANERSVVVAEFEQKARSIAEFRTVVDAARSEKSRDDLALGHAESELSRAREAAAIIEKVRPDADRYDAACGRLKELERERSARENLNTQLSKTENALAKVSAEQKTVAERLDNSMKAAKAIELLIPRAKEQERLEKDCDDLRGRLANANAARSQIASLDDKLARLRDSYRGNKELLDEALQKAADAAETGELELRDAEIVRELARLRAALERDELFQNEIKNGLCPILSEKCLNLKDGQTLDGFIKTEFAEVKTQIDTLQIEHTTVTVRLRVSREAEKFAAQVTAYKRREDEIGEEGKKLKAEREQLEAASAAAVELEKELKKVEALLKELDSPRTKIQLLESEGRREFELRDELRRTEMNLERLESERRILVEQLESYINLDADIAATSAIRDETENAHRTYLSHQSYASSLPECETKFSDAGKAAELSAAKLANAQKTYDEAAKDYDEAKHATARTELLQLQRDQVKLESDLAAARRREAELTKELARLAETKKELQVEFAERGRLASLLEATEFIRSTLRDAAPLVAKNYVRHVSMEANQMFREIGGKAEQNLRWNDDYGITVEEGGHERPFVSLSGGEQMAAALSVRLALLKQLSEIRIAFFDEPTTNMDAERRENLAIQISQIKHFDQLFVISHDDTFEGYVDNVVHVERANNEQNI